MRLKQIIGCISNKIQTRRQFILFADLKQVKKSQLVLYCNHERHLDD